MAECLRAEVLNLFGVLGPFEIMMEAMNPFATFTHKHLPAFSRASATQYVSSVAPRLRTPAQSQTLL